jgi:SpoVK/Ycf46/Vps4 family AAA+-type ATPase
MALGNYKPLFSEYHQGAKPFLHLLSKAIAPSRDAALTDDDKQKLKDAVTKSAKKQQVSLLLCGLHESYKAIEVAHIAYQNQQHLCLIECNQLVNQYIGETEKNIAQLVADAENKNGILFFDEADALFAHQSNADNSTIGYQMLQRLKQFPGLIILNLQNEQYIQSIEQRFDYKIHFK